MQNINILEQIKIIYEDEYLLAINKPSGLIVHSDGRTEEANLIDWIIKYCIKNNIDKDKQKNIGLKHTLDNGRYEYRWGILNRLDRETSGIILIAKDKASFFAMQKNWPNIEKKYVAILHGKIVEKDIFEINEPLSRHKKDPRIWVLKSDKNSRSTTRDAKSLCEVLEIIEVIGQKFTRVNFWPITGRTNQLRLHAKFLKNPILGDKKYSFGGIDETLAIDKKNRLMLHAESIKFIHPILNKEIEIVSKIDFPEIML